MTNKAIATTSGFYAPGYAEQRHVAWREIREEYLSDPDVRREYEEQRSEFYDK